ncbi:cAMP-regulated phosphoprotein 21 isoform X13 [Panthera pardus]|uniref:cAMP-regulated phosphoprotein 21 isoform X13 n=1 Tax=Panthera pardus TaxID=9691 RepID=A0A9W2VN28_PANPR|nr:cAMP-regulated phosphoprotein 21 isoform X13 [Panthera pardus]XP_058585313.1 cAMP-regulated phosphoprotein 21 isoform X18 [Neofelis nebulosa]
MSEPGDLNPAIVEEGGTEQESATPENGIVKSESLDEEEKLELQRRLAAQNQERRKSKSGAGKGKLTRSLAVCEESSARPGGESLQDQESIHLQLSSFPSLQEDDKSRKDDSEREKEKDKNKDKTSEKPKIRMLSKDCSQEYTDSTGIDLHEFLINTLKNNSRDRMILLKMEQEIIDFIGDNNNHYKKFPQMSSYQRMLVHRVAAYFGLDHNVDQTGKSVIINKTSNTRIQFAPRKAFLWKPVGSWKTVTYAMRPIRKDSSFGWGNRDGSGRAAGSRQSSSENELKWSDHHRPWSSTDSDGSNRNLKPAMAKTASFGGITVLTRGDSTSSTRSPGKLSKAGSSESNSSTGSSGSLPRTHAPLQSAPLAPSVSTGSPGCVPYPENGGGGQAAPSTSYILLPLEAATGIPPGSILLNPHTGQPFVNPDGTPAIYNPPSSQQPLRGTMMGQSQQPPQQQPSPQPQQQVQPPQPHLAGPLVTQSVQGLQASSQSVQYPAVSFPPQHLLPVSPTQQFPMRDDVATQFTQMNLSRQSSGETPEPPSGPVYPASLMPQPAQQPSYVIASTGQQLPAGGFSGSGPSISQQVLQAPPSPQGFVQQPPPAQMPVYYYPSGQYPTSATQQYRPLASVQYGAQRGQQIPQAAQQAGYQPVLSGQQGFQGLIGVQQPSQSQNVMSNQPGNPVQGVMVSYPTMSSYQVPMTQGSQGLPQQSYQQPILLPDQAGQGSLQATGMPVYCNVTPPTPQNNLRLIGPHCPSSTVPVMSASCRTNCASVSHTGWQVKF